MGAGIAVKRAIQGSFLNSRSRSQMKITGVTMRMWSKLEIIPPITGVANGFMISALGGDSI